MALEPITRQEQIIAGKDLQPITRMEKFLKEYGGGGGDGAVQSVNGKTGKVELTAEDVGAISRDDLQEATNQALAQAKESGEFDGEPGADGDDYVLTAADKEEIAGIAAGMVEVPEGSGGGIAITGATVGQTVIISAVDENGVPTAWEPVEFPSGGGADWTLLGEYKFSVGDKKLYINLSQYDVTHFRILGSFPKCTEDCGVLHVRLGTGFNQLATGGTQLHNQNVYAFNLFAECELYDGQLYGYMGMINGWGNNSPATVVRNTPRDGGKNTDLTFYYVNAVNDSTENTVQIWGY